MQNHVFIILIGIHLLTTTGCSDNQPDTDSKPEVFQATDTTYSQTSAGNSLASRHYSEQRAPCSDFIPTRKALFGELHVHTSLSFDAAAVRTKTLPADAYRFARGEAIPFFPVDTHGNVTGKIAIDRPLDFAAVTDHSEYLGETALCRQRGSPAYNGRFCVEYRKIEFRGSAMIATSMSGDHPERIALLCGEDGELCRKYAAGPWQMIIDAAEDAYDRSPECRFTTFIGYEYTGSPNNSNYHRNVIFKNSNVPALPVTYMENPLDYLLWEELNNVCNDNNGCNYLTIPHNSNLSNGRLLTPYADLETTIVKRREYALARLQSEPIMEIFQHKGSSECINGLSNVVGAPDELCDFEQIRKLGSVAKRINISLNDVELVLETEDAAAVTTECEEEHGSHGMMGAGCVSANDFLRTALLTGLSEEQEIGVNPVKFGVVAASDGHTTTPGSVKEDEWGGYVTGEMTPENRLQPGTLPSGILGSPGGLAGVWAEENSRDAIFNAMQRREVFGTSGPRIVPRFFGGWTLAPDSCELADMTTEAYANGVPMGGDLEAPPDKNSKPSFIVSALRDPLANATPLQQLQIIKGWVNNEGISHFKIITAAGTPDNGAGVDTTNGTRFGEGHASLCAVFTDTEFDAGMPSYYYLRVVENPSPRWSLLDCLKHPEADRPEVCEDSSRHVIQEMAWTSPIWYSPRPQ